MTTSSVTASEHQAIAETVQLYVDGGRSGRSADMKAAFHPDATIFGYVGDELFAGPIQKMFDWNDQNGPAKELQVRLAGIDVTGSIATVSVDAFRGRKLAGHVESLAGGSGARFSLLPPDNASGNFTKP